MLELMGADVWMRHTGTDGKSYVQCHRIWDKAVFLSQQQKAIAEVNAKQKDGLKLAKVEQITEEQYFAERKK